MVIDFGVSLCRMFTACPFVFLRNFITLLSIISCTISRKCWQSWMEWPTDLLWYKQYCLSRSFFSFFFYCSSSNIPALSKATYTVFIGIQTALTFFSIYSSGSLSTAFIFDLWWSGRGFPLTLGMSSSSNVKALALIRSWTLCLSVVQSSVECPLLLEW